MQALFETAAYMPHGYCLFWQPWLVLLYAGSDLLIFLSYSAIPLALLIFLRRRPDVRYRGLVGLFAAFILLCGLTHLVSIFTLWDPAYPLHGLVKLVTGIVSATTAVVLFTLIPRLAAIPSPQQLERANARLVEELAAHRETLARLQEAERAVEAKIEQRTAELAEANRQLAVISREALHRRANLSAVIMSLARETARRAPDVATFMERFSGRVAALAGAAASMTSHGDSVLLGDVVRRQLDPMLQTYGERIEIHGPEVELSAMAAQHFGLAVHELATNAVKHGALSVCDGRVAVSWERGQDGLETMTFRWRETGRWPEAGSPTPQDGTAGFGTRLLTIAVPEALHGKCSRTLGTEGLCYELLVPLARIAGERRDRGDDASGSPVAPLVPA